ncbi:MAG: aminotransferase class I/II-fold pyridoxal phosphate-dependent enzyme [Actinobacteria bacterium]|nr:aminotransferase class I/II-fold pyridoxal phosphate-dependent enzyme [Actinomycetota bacterium]
MSEQLVSAALSGLDRSGIREVMDLAASLEDVIHLELGEPSFPTPPHVVEAVSAAIADGRVRYTLSRGTPELREAIVAKLASRNRIVADSSEVVVSSGGTTAITIAMMALLDPGDGVLFPDPGWPTFRLATALLRADPLPYAVRAEEGYAPDLEQVEALAPSARVLIVNSPANPTGAVLERGRIEALLAIAERHGLTVISDEVYEDIVFEGEHVSAAALGSEAPVISIFSFSKGYAMTGWRIGYAVAPPAVAEAMVKAQEAVIACPSDVGQRAALAALNGPQDCLAAMRESYRGHLDAALAALAAGGLECVVPRGAFYAMVGLGPAAQDTFAFARRLLLEERVAVAPGETFGPAGAGTVRISLATEPDALGRGIAGLARAVARTTTETGGS